MVSFALVHAGSQLWPDSAEELDGMLGHLGLASSTNSMFHLRLPPNPIYINVPLAAYIYATTTMIWLAIDSVHR